MIRHTNETQLELQKDSIWVRDALARGLAESAVRTYFDGAEKHHMFVVHLGVATAMSPTFREMSRTLEM